MSQKTKIEWTESTWNPMSGCTKVSAGCANCYAETMANRLKAMGTKGYENGFAVTLHPEKLDVPLKRKKPTMYFVCSMGDLFHESVPFEFVDKIFDMMFVCPQHTFQILTKRPERMRKYIKERAYSKHFGWGCDSAPPFKYGEIIHLDDLYTRNMCGYAEHDFECDCNHLCSYPDNSSSDDDCEHGHRKCFSWNCPIATENPHKSLLEKEGLEDQYKYDDEGYSEDCEWMQIHQRPKGAYVLNVWLGVTAENQEQADKRIPILLDTPAAVRFVSIEPMLEKINLFKESEVQGDPAVPHICVDWVIVGGETGAGARPLQYEWVKSIQEQCETAKVPFFFKKWGKTAYYKGQKLTNARVSDGMIDGVECRQMPEVMA